MAEATLYKEAINVVDYQPTTAKSSGEVVQLADGRAAVVETALAASGLGAALTVGIFKMAKTTSMVVLNGQKLYWDKANSKVKYFGDFYVGVAMEDALAADTLVKVAINVEQKPVIAMGKGQWAEEATDGEGVTEIAGASVEQKLSFDAVAEIAQAALFSVDTIALDQLPIFEAWIAIYDIGDNAALDINFGVANASHATDFDSVTEACVFHLDGSALAIKAESDDGSTEVNATDTTKLAVDDAYTFFQIDMRNLADIQMYINGVLVLPGTTFKLDAATGPIKPIVHLEKTSDNTLADVRVREMNIRTLQTA